MSKEWREFIGIRTPLRIVCPSHSSCNFRACIVYDCACRSKRNCARVGCVQNIGGRHLESRFAPSWAVLDDLQSIFSGMKHLSIKKSHVDRKWLLRPQGRLLPESWGPKVWNIPEVSWTLDSHRDIDISVSRKQTLRTLKFRLLRICRYAGLKVHAVQFGIIDEIIAFRTKQVPSLRVSTWK